MAISGTQNIVSFNTFMNVPVEENSSELLKEEIGSLDQKAARTKKILSLFPEEKTVSREDEIISWLLQQIFHHAFSPYDAKDFESWLRIEGGVTNEEIQSLKDKGCFPIFS